VAVISKVTVVFANKGSKTNNSNELVDVSTEALTATPEIRVALKVTV
jgi:hypothetical protein